MVGVCVSVGVEEGVGVMVLVALAVGVGEPSRVTSAGMVLVCDGSGGAVGMLPDEGPSLVTAEEI